MSKGRYVAGRAFNFLLKVRPGETYIYHGVRFFKGVDLSVLTIANEAVIANFPSCESTVCKMKVKVLSAK